jgi:hypothetical protein
LDVLKIVGLLTVVVEHGVVERIDAAEVFGIERMLSAHFVGGGGLGAQIGLEKVQHRAEDRQARQAELTAFCFQAADQAVLKQCVENDSGRFLEIDQRPIKLLLGPYQRMDMLDRQDFGVLRRRRPADRDQGFAGRVRDQVEVKIARCLRHWWTG